MWCVLILVLCMSVGQAWQKSDDCAPLTVFVVNDVNDHFSGDFHVDAFYRVGLNEGFIYIDRDTDINELFHEFGHHVGVTCFNDGSEQFARLYARTL